MLTLYVHFGIDIELLNAVFYTLIVFGGTGFGLIRHIETTRWHWVTFTFLFLMHGGILYYILHVLDLHIPWWIYLLFGIPEGLAILFGMSMISNVPDIQE